ncbi:hypothetical protein CCR75_006778 [Bremia lactucae]|uniref:Uncharacterized protein n=1 Tax=Bremia lactucae TaxID=4779 RepID=A0A976FMT5_BRELC|nr:hypothetical protein CCR75_001316 [Bremia lactucae]TDH69608.1 hypothetical protein CCR75_008861 [Bremia lactucae]TDH70013.1 hypothetical protein CCR75_006778 [Bremia lactucae]
MAPTKSADVLSSNCDIETNRIIEGSILAWKMGNPEGSAYMTYCRPLTTACKYEGHHHPNYWYWFTLTVSANQINNNVEASTAYASLH